MPAVTTTYDTSTGTYDQSSLSYDGYPAPLSGMPAVGVFVAWTDGPYVASPSWTEITPYVRQINIRRGRQDDLQQFPPGTAQLVLDNRDRLFDPFNTAGANYANLKPRKQIKIVANWNSVEYPLYRGYIAGWPVEYTDAGFDSTVTIDCFDGLGLMANEIVPTDWADFYTRAQNPTVYFKGDDSQGTAIIRDAISNGAKFLFNTNSATNPNFFEAPQLAPGAASKSVFAQSYRGVNLTNVAEPSVIVGDFPILSVSAWCKGTGSQTLRQLEPASIRIATFLHKPEATNFSVPLDYVGFSIPNKFVVGYGLDYDGLGRNFGALYQLV